jgi:hypothetical protein
VAVAQLETLGCSARRMKTRMILWLAVTVILCFAAFWFGRSRSQPVYDQNPLRIDFSLLTGLRAGHTTNVVEALDAMLEMETLAAMRNRASLDERDRKMLDQTLERVARYRQQHPWHIDTNTNGFGNPAQLKQYEGWIAEQKQVEAFLHSFEVTNEQPNTALEPTPTAP